MNAVMELSKFGGQATEAHLKAMYSMMSYCLGIAMPGLYLKPEGSWDGKSEGKFVIKGKADSNFATDPDTRRSVSGYAGFVNGAPVTMKSGAQIVMVLSVTEAELFAATQCAQDMIFVLRTMESLKLKVKKPMVLENVVEETFPQR